jgi:hypothetical protein
MILIFFPLPVCSQDHEHDHDQEQEDAAYGFAALVLKPGAVCL